MKKEEIRFALDVLEDFQEWRRYDGPIPDSPPQPDPYVVGKAIDSAIAILKGLVSEPQRDYYGG